MPFLVTWFLRRNNDFLYVTDNSAKHVVAKMINLLRACRESSIKGRNLIVDIIQGYINKNESMLHRRND